MPRQVAVRTKLTDAIDKHVLSILTENEKRIKEINTPFSPIKGEGCGDKRFLLFLPDFPIQKQHLPMSMKKIPTQIYRRMVRLYLTLFSTYGAINPM